MMDNDKVAERLRKLCTDFRSFSVNNIEIEAILDEREQMKKRITELESAAKQAQYELDRWCRAPKGMYYGGDMNGALWALESALDMPSPDKDEQD